MASGHEERDPTYPLPMRLVLLSLSFLLVALPAHADEALWSTLAKGGNLVLIRHGLTSPGVGDPPGYRVDDCASQRNSRS